MRPIAPDSSPGGGLPTAERKFRLRLSNDQACIALQPILRNDQVGRRGTHAEHPPGKIVFRAVAWAEKLAIGAEAGLQLGNAALMRALPDGNE